MSKWWWQDELLSPEERRIVKVLCACLFMTVLAQLIALIYFIYK